VAFGINNRGQIVGTYADAKQRRGFMLSNGTFTTLTAPGACLSLFSWVSTITAG
jgi:probable HAF family extracellular repeat protein